MVDICRVTVIIVKKYISLIIILNLEFIQILLTTSKRRQIEHQDNQSKQMEHYVT